MDYMFWVWLAVLVVAAIVELATREIVSIWFTFGAIIPFILAGTKAVGWEWQLVIFILLSAVLIIALRPLTKKFFLKNNDLRTNTDAYVGNRYRLLTGTDFETVGSLKINDVVWSAVEENRQAVKAGEVVEVVKVAGNKLVVRKTEKETDT